MALRRVTATGGMAYEVSDRVRSAGVRHAFSTRSCGDFAAGAGDREANYARLSAAADLPAARWGVRQVHGATVVRAGLGGDIEADAIVSDVVGLTVGVRVADCGAVVMASAGGGVVAVVHAGWRGVIAGVVGAAAREMRAMGAAPVVAGVGPCIGRGRFEVGAEVVAEFDRVFGDVGVVDRRADGKGMVDLSAAIVRQLAAEGVEAADVSAGCTMSDGDYFSHRRGESQRMVLLATVGGQ